MAIRTFIEAIREGMASELRRDPFVIVLGEDVGKKGGVFLATDGLWAEFGDDRVIDTPLTESMIVGAAIGAAMLGEPRGTSAAIRGPRGRFAPPRRVRSRRVSRATRPKRPVRTCDRSHRPPCGEAVPSSRL